jgi:hypothetical protein
MSHTSELSVNRYRFLRQIELDTLALEQSRHCPHCAGASCRFYSLLTDHQRTSDTQLQQEKYKIPDIFLGSFTY